MKASRLFTLALLSCVSLCVGCASSAPLVRGQSPSAQNQGIQQVGYGYVAGHLNHETDVTLYHQSSEVGTYSTGGCPTGDCDQGSCNPNSGKAPCWHPTHHHTFSYEQPNNLKYPTSQPGSLIRYPYYTFKGPDCFFHQ